MNHLVMNHLVMNHLVMALAVTTGSVVFFVALHGVVLQRVDLPFAVALKLSRTLAAVILVAIGVISLIHFAHLWPRAFMIEQPPGTPIYYATALILGHFLADLLWLGHGAQGHGSSPRKDLIAHHVAGAVATLLAFAFGIGYALIGVAMITEVMPIATGVVAWARSRRDPVLERRGFQASLASSIFVRLPLWLLVLSVVTYNAFTITDPKWRLLYAVSIPIALALITMDLLWCREFVRRLNPAQSSVRGSSA